MENLKKVLEEYGEWEYLIEYIDRIDAFIDIDFSTALENSKSLLEAIGKRVCEINGVKLTKTSSLNVIVKQSFKSLGFKNSDMVKQVSTSLATIGQHVGDLRNEIGLTAHGKTAEEVRERNNKVDSLTKEFLIASIEIICIYLIRNSEITSTKTDENESVVYEDNSAFNDWWDEQYGEFEMGSYTYFASEILFQLDNNAYFEEYQLFMDEKDNKE